VIIEKSQFSNPQIVKLVKGAVVPRPIAWISSTDKNGLLNLSPFSFFNIISTNPVMFMVAFAPGAFVGKTGHKDTLSNILETEDFVINLVSAALSERMQKSSEVFEKDVNEFDEAGLTATKSRLISSPRVEEAPISMECELRDVLEFGNFRQVVGELVCIHIKDDVYLEGDKVNYNNFDPIGRMAANYTHTRDLFFPGEE
jgi:flavin reductase (DIM6/NTAB) family NADH-FMN oxidoreductase RutF